MPSRTPFSATANAVYQASDHDKMPKGLIGYESTSTDTTGVTSSITDLTGLSVTVTVPADRIVVVSGFVPRIASDTANDAVEVLIREGATVIQSMFSDLSARAVGSSGGNPAKIESVPFNPSAGSHTYKLSMVRATGGSGVLETVLDADSLGCIRVDDLGPAF